MLIKLFEEYNTSVFKVDNMYFTLHIEETEPIHIYIMIDNYLYAKLSIILPQSSKLEKDEFFLNPNLNEKIVRVLLNQNFISETGKEVMAGDKKTKSYILV